jgi:uncharacterized protein (TIGR04255 family)
VGTFYKKPPVAEAIAEFRFPPGSEPDLAVPGLVYERLKAHFPKARAAIGLEASVEANQGVIQQRFAQTPRLQLLTPDERVVVQVSPNWMAVNHLPPYDSWEKYAPIIDKAFDAYVKSASVTTVLGLSLRYANQIQLGGLASSVGIEQFFTVYPRLEGEAILESNFRLGFQFPRDDSKGILQIEMAPAEGPGGRSIQFDIAYFHSGAAPVEVSAVRAWLTKAHEEVEAFFERAIRDSLREHFGGKTS